MSAAKKSSDKFAIRGIVEGFFGSPWSHTARMDMIKFMADAGYNCYIYAPKDDPFHRDRWREDYPKPIARNLSRLAAECTMRGVDFCWALSPGLSIKYSSNKHFEELCAKFLSMAHLGVKTFALFLDDIPEQIQYAEDKRKFSSLAAAHASLANRILERVQAAVPDARLWFCPTAYFGSGDSEYIATLGKGLDRKIEVFWTGPEVVSPKISSAQVRAFSNALGRKPLLWDNYPVNDYNRSTLNIGPIRGRDPKLGSHLAGYFTNPMNEPYASKIPLLSIADYLREPDKYVAEKSFRNAVRTVCGAEAVAPLTMLAQYGGASVLEGQPRPVSDAALKASRDGKGNALLAKLAKAESIRVEIAAAVEDAAMRKDLARQARRVEDTAKAARLVFDALSAEGDKRAKIMAKLIPLAKSLRARHRFISPVIEIDELIFELISMADPETKIENWIANELFVKGIMN